MQPHRSTRLIRHLSAAAVAAFALLASATTIADEASAPIELSDDNPFTIDVKGAKAKVGERAVIIVSVKAETGYKCNDKYKHKIKKLKATAGAKLDADVVPGTIKGKSVVFEVGVTPTQKGDAAVSGEIRFSVCNDSQCVIKKAPLNATVTGT